MATGKEIRFGVEGRAAMLKGVDLLADAVQVSACGDDISSVLML
jgi:chaperonin GroEL